MDERARLRFLVLNGWLIGFCLVYLVTALALPRFTYFPIERRWELIGETNGLNMVYYGQLLWGVLGGGLGGGVGAVVARLLPLSREGCLLLLGWTVTLLLFTLLANGIQVFSA